MCELCLRTLPARLILTGRSNPADVEADATELADALAVAHADIWLGPILAIDKNKLGKHE